MCIVYIRTPSSEMRDYFFAKAANTLSMRTVCDGLLTTGALRKGLVPSVGVHGCLVPSGDTLSVCVLAGVVLAICMPSDILSK